MRLTTLCTRAGAAIALLVGVAACGGDSDETGSDPVDTTTTTSDDDTVVVASDFSNGSDGWAGDVSDFSEATPPEDVVVSTTATPPNLDADAEGFVHLAASNRSDDLFLYLRRPVMPAGTLQPSTTYDLTFDVRFASAAPSGCAGIGGAPGESQWLKVGASPEEPAPIQTDGDTRLAVDKGNQSQGGDDAVVAGVIANGIPCEEALSADERPWAMVERSGSLQATTAPDGSLWLFVGTDSGFEGRTSLYYDEVRVTLEPAT